MTGRHAWAAAAVAAVWVAWWQATLAAPHWPQLPTGIGVLLAAAAAVGAVGAGTVRAVAAGVAVAAAAVVTTAWVAASKFVDPPAVLLDRAVVVVAAVWGISAVVWRFAPVPTGEGRQGRKESPLRAALAASGIAGLAPSGDGEKDLVRVGRGKRRGLGDTYVVELPAGVTAVDLTGRAERVAGALGRRTTDLEIEVGDHASQAVVWVGDKGAGATQAGTWPGIPHGGKVSALDPINIGLDRYGQPVTINLHGGSGVLIGSLPGQGKSSLMNLIIASVMADTRARLWVADFKGGADFAAWRDACHGWVCGAPGDDPQQVLDCLESFKKDMELKTARLPEFSATKIAGDLADERGMGPSLLVIDEAHELFSRTSSVPAKLRDEAIAIVRAVIARGRAVNSWVLIASQRVTDDEIPASITQRVTVRVAFRLGTQPASLAVLGPDTWAQGFRATECPAAGVGLLAVDGSVSRVRAWYVPDAMAYECAAAVVEAARSREPDTGPPTPVLTSQDVEALSALEAGAPHPGWLFDPSDTQARMLAAEQARLAELEAGGCRSGADDARCSVDVAAVVDMVSGVWPEGQRGPLEAVSVAHLAELAGVDVSWLDDALREAGVPVDVVRFRAADGTRPRTAGVRRDSWEEFLGRAR